MTPRRLLRDAALGLVAWLPIHAAVAGDEAFTIAVESSVHRFGIVRRYDQVLPPRHARLIKNLGCGSFTCREEAERSIRAIGPANLRLLAWGAWSKDAEVAARCRRMLAQRFPCDHCSASGVCPLDGEGRYCWQCRHLMPDWCDERHAGACWLCDGTGDSRARP